MARESIFARKKREKGTNWHRQLASNDLFKMSESILNDMAYSNMDNPEDKQYLYTVEIMESLWNFCNLRYSTLNYIHDGLVRLRTDNAYVGNLGDNVQFFNVFNNIEVSTGLYNALRFDAQQYLQTYIQSYVDHMIELCKQYRNYIAPNRFI